MRSLSALSVVMLMAATPLLAQRYHDPDEAKFAVTNLETLNTAADEYSPYETPSGRWLYFTTSRTGSANILRAPRLGDGWGSPEEPVEPSVNTDHDEGSFTAPIPRLAQLFELVAQILRAVLTPIGILRERAADDAPQLLRGSSVHVGDRRGLVAHDRGLPARLTCRPARVRGGSFLVAAEVDRSERGHAGDLPDQPHEGRVGRTGTGGEADGRSSPG